MAKILSILRHDLLLIKIAKRDIFLRHIDCDRCPKENHISWAGRIIIARNLCIHILPALPFPPPFSMREFLSFGKFFTLPICPIVDISKCTSITRSPANDNKEKELLNIFTLLYSLLIFVIKNEKKRNEGKVYLRFSRLDAN